MDAALFQRFSPEEYYGRFLADGVRPDGRSPHERRRVRLQRSAIGAARGSAVVRLGQAAAIAGVRAEVAEALPDLFSCGSIVVAVELPPLCSAVFREKQRALGASNFLSSALTDILNSPHVFDPAQLDVHKERRLSWVVHVHVVCLNYDGNAFDLCLLAALAAIEDTALPALAEGPAPVEGAAQPALLVEAAAGAHDVVAEARRLVLRSRPLPATFAQLPGHQWVLDPCAAEEGLGASVSLCLVGGSWSVYHQGGGASKDCFLGELMPVARSCTRALAELLESAEEDLAEAGGVAGDAAGRGPLLR